MSFQVENETSSSAKQTRGNDNVTSKNDSEDLFEEYYDENGDINTHFVNSNNEFVHFASICCI